jgi:hypothetical protein
MRAGGFSPPWYARSLRRFVPAMTTLGDGQNFGIVIGDPPKFPAHVEHLPAGSSGIQFFNHIFSFAAKLRP